MRWRGRMAGLLKDLASGRLLAKLPKALGQLPGRWRWTLHNLVAHPVSEVLWQLGARRWATRIHDLTAPAERRT